jgi:hypothetical protein
MKRMDRPRDLNPNAILNGRDSLLSVCICCRNMVHISVDELLPIAHQYRHSHTVIFGVILGIFIMAISLLML